MEEEGEAGEDAATVDAAAAAATGDAATAAATPAAAPVGVDAFSCVLMIVFV